MPQDLQYSQKTILNMHPQLLGFWAILGGAFIFSFTPILVRLSQTDPTSAGFWRIALGLPFLLGVMLPQQRKTQPPSTRTLQDYLWLGLVGLVFSLNLSIVHTSLFYTTVAHSTLLVNTAPFFVVLVSWFLLGQRPSHFFLMSLTISFLGAILLMWPHLATSGKLKGDCMAIAAAFFYGLYMMTLAKAREKFSSIEILAYSGIVSAITLFTIIQFTGESLSVASSNGWKALIAIAYLSHIGGQTLVAFSLAYIPATMATLVLLVQPVGTALLGWIFFSETLMSIQLLGMGLILSGITFAKLQQNH